MKKPNVIIGPHLLVKFVEQYINAGGEPLKEWLKFFAYFENGTVIYCEDMDLSEPVFSEDFYKKLSKTPRETAFIAAQNYMSCVDRNPKYSDYIRVAYTNMLNCGPGKDGDIVECQEFAPRCFNVMREGNQNIGVNHFSELRNSKLCIKKISQEFETRDFRCPVLTCIFTADHEIIELKDAPSK